MITLGAVIAAAGLEFFLVPNNILDGGVIGLSIIAAELTGLTMSIFLIVLNLPFLYIGFRKIGMKFTIHTLYGVIVLSASTAYLHHFEPVTNDLFLATVIGAVILGTGVGLVIQDWRSFGRFRNYRHPSQQEAPSVCRPIHHDCQRIYIYSCGLPRFQLGNCHVLHYHLLYCI